MKPEIERVPILRLTEQDRCEIEDTVVTEISLTIILDGQELTTLLCSPTKLEYLAIGFLCSEGLIKSKDEIKKMTVDDQRGVAWLESEQGKEFAAGRLLKRVVTSGGLRRASLHGDADAQSQAKIESGVEISAREVFSLVSEFQNRSPVFKATGGVHSAALCDTKGILVFSEDIGRHNAIDKVFGECVLTDIPTDDRIILSSGRIASEILLKAAKRNIPIIISVAPPTDLAVRLAGDLGVTLVGFVREGRMNVYTHGWRVRMDYTTRQSRARVPG
ncbi:formate dehydrogenase accessory sulfurtransferase FdhD [Chloroflexota bacterium]